MVCVVCRCVFFFFYRRLSCVDAGGVVDVAASCWCCDCRSMSLLCGIVGVVCYCVLLRSFFSPLFCVRCVLLLFIAMFDSCAVPILCCVSLLVAVRLVAACCMLIVVVVGVV